ncbi:MAG: hypothetical protein PHX45_00690 [Acidobacteriota bacterium]|nr:hypothetical protein [Acidobacteriota bacterium]
MPDNAEMIRESTSIIQEIELQLEKLLQEKKEDIERALASRITQEKEAARKKADEVETEFEKERESLSEYRMMVKEVEDERAVLMNQIKEHFRRIVHYQAEVENMARLTAEEIKKVNDIYRKIEDLRRASADKAAFLKKDLEERFGIVAQIPAKREAEPEKLDLDQEIQKLKRIKELLAMEVIPAGDREAAGAEAGAREPEPDAEINMKIPEIQDLVQTLPAGPEDVAAAEAEETGRPEPDHGEGDEDISEALDGFRRSEPTNSSGEINYFQKGKRMVLDGEQLMWSVGYTLDEAKKLSVKLGLTESPRDQFFLKQELINWQENLRRLLAGTIRLCEKKSLSLPSRTADILNIQTLKDLLERLNMENWGNPRDFQSFESLVRVLRNSFQTKAGSPSAYLKSVRNDLQAP